MQHLSTAKIRMMDHPARTMDDKPHRQQPDQEDKKFPRRCLHALASLAGASIRVKLRNPTPLQLGPTCLTVRSRLLRQCEALLRWRGRRVGRRRGQKKKPGQQTPCAEQSSRANGHDARDVAYRNSNK